jgi:hypothetical protein
VKISPTSAEALLMVFLSSRAKVKLKIHQLKEGILTKSTTKLSYAEITKTNLGFDIEQCPCCKTGKMIIFMQFGANSPPRRSNDELENRL